MVEPTAGWRVTLSLPTTQEKFLETWNKTSLFLCPIISLVTLTAIAIQIIPNAQLGAVLQHFSCNSLEVGTLEVQLSTAPPTDKPVSQQNKVKQSEAVVMWCLTFGATLQPAEASLVPSRHCRHSRHVAAHGRTLTPPPAPPPPAAPPRIVTTLQQHIRLLGWCGDVRGGGRSRRTGAESGSWVQHLAFHQAE